MGYPDSKVHGANMGPTCVLSAPGGPHVGLMNLAIWVFVHIKIGDTWLNPNGWHLKHLRREHIDTDAMQTIDSATINKYETGAARY